MTQSVVFANPGSYKPEAAPVTNPTGYSFLLLKDTDYEPVLIAPGDLPGNSLPYSTVGATGADYTSIVAALTDGKTDLLVINSTTEPSDYAFPTAILTININFMADAFVDVGDFVIYDATTNNATVSLNINGPGGTLNCGHTWSPTTEKSLIDFTGAGPGSRFSTSKCVYNTGSATASAYHVYNGNSDSAMFGYDNTFIMADTSSIDLLTGYNIIMSNPIVFGSGSSCSGFAHTLGGAFQIIGPVFVNGFSTTSPLLLGDNLVTQGGKNFTGGEIIIGGNNLCASNFAQIIPGAGFSFLISSDAHLSNINSPDGILYLQDGFTTSSIDNCTFADINESGCSSFNLLNITNSVFKNAGINIGNNSIGTWQLSNVSFSENTAISAKNLTYTGGAIGAPSSGKDLTINLGALNTVVTGVRTLTAITNSEPTAQVGFNPLFA